MCSSPTPAASSAELTDQSCQIVRPTASARMSDGPSCPHPAGQDDDTTNSNYPANANANAGASSNKPTTAPPAAASSLEQQQVQPLPTSTAPLNDAPGHSAGPYRPTAQTQTVTQNPNPTSSSSDAALLDDLERWCHRQFGTGFASTTTTSAASSAGGGAAGGARKRMRVESNPFQMPQMAQMAQQAQHMPQVQQQPQPQPPPPAQGLSQALVHSLTTSPSSLTNRKTILHRPTANTSFADLLQLLPVDAQELKEAIATGSVFDEHDMGGLMGSGSSLMYDDMLAGIGLEGTGGEQQHPHHHQKQPQQQVKMPSSIAGSMHGSSGGGSDRSSQNNMQGPPPLPQQPASYAYEMMTSDVVLPAETREELRVAYPTSMQSNAQTRPTFAQQQSYQGQQPQQVHPGQPPQQMYPGEQPQQQQPQSYHQHNYQVPMIPTALDEVTPRSSNVHSHNHSNIHTNSKSAYPTTYNTPQDYSQPPSQPPQPQSVASQYRFVESLEFSTQSERLLREWDRSMGLKACHSKTMLKTSKSRKKLLEKVKVDMVSAVMVYPPTYQANHAYMFGGANPSSLPTQQPLGYASTTYYGTPAAAPKKEDDTTAAVRKTSGSSDGSFQDKIEKNRFMPAMA